MSISPANSRNYRKCHKGGKIRVPFSISANQRRCRLSAITPNARLPLMTTQHIQYLSLVFLLVIPSNGNISPALTFKPKALGNQEKKTCCNFPWKLLLVKIIGFFETLIFSSYSFSLTPTQSVKNHLSILIRSIVVILNQERLEKGTKTLNV